MRDSLFSAGDWIALGAVGASLASTAFIAWNARRLAREERKYESLAETYVLIADYAARMRQYALTAFPDVPDESPLRAPPLSEEDWWGLQARVVAFGSDSIRKEFDELLTLATRTRTAVASWREQRDLARGGPPEERREALESRKGLSELREALRLATGEIMERIRSELKKGHDV